MLAPTGYRPLIASIPPPSRNSLEIGPLTFNYYGLMIALGVLAAVEIGRRRWTATGGNPDDIIELTKWVVPAGLVGARAYHVATDWKTYIDSPLAALEIWNGGLGIPGGLLAGVGTGIWYARRQGWSVTGLLDAVVPGVPVAQAIGRLGNWFNQEIVGGPTDLPWALEVDRPYRPADFVESSTFHPAFLYEGLLNLAIACVLVLFERSKRLKPGQILPLWIALYGAARFVVESIRTDHASLLFDIRVNHWSSGAAVAVGLVWLVWLGRRTPAHPTDLMVDPLGVRANRFGWVERSGFGGRVEASDCADRQRRSDSCAEGRSRDIDGPAL